MKFCLDPGHGGIQPGAVNNGVAEKNITLPITLEIGRHLQRHNQQVVYTRTTDVDVDLQERCDIANNSNCDYFLSIHCNSFSSDASGTETFYFVRYEKGKELATKIQEATISYNKNISRGVKDGSGLYVINSTHMPAVLHELLFLSNDREFSILTDTTWQKNIAAVIAKAMLEFIGIEWVEENQEKKEDEVKNMDIKNRLELPIGYLEFLSDRLIIHYDAYTYITIGQDGIWVYGKDKQPKQII